MSRDVKVKDVEYEQAGREVKNYFHILEYAIQQYKEIINTIGSTAITTGEVHDAIIRYSEYVENLQLITKNLGENFERLTLDYIYEIEKADDYLYDAGIVNMVRDFSEDEYKHLVSCLDDPWCAITDSIGDWFYDKVKKIVDFFHWDDIKITLQKSHRLLLDYNDETAQGLKLLFVDVQKVDKKYGQSIEGATSWNGNYQTSYFAYIDLSMCEIRNLLNTMAEIIAPGNGEFTASNIDERLGESFRQLIKYYQQVISIQRPDGPLTTDEITKFASQSWASSYFLCFSGPMGEFIQEIGGLDSVKITIFNMFGVAIDTLIYGNYEQYLTEQQLLDILEDMTIEDQYSQSDEKKEIENVNFFLKYIKKYGDNWYKYLNTNRDSDGKLLLDGRTKEAKKFNEFLNGIGGAQTILQFGDKAAEYIAQLFTDYSRGLEIIESFERNYSANSTMIAAVAEIKELYNKEFNAWANRAIKDAMDVGFDVALGKLGDAIPVVAVINTIRSGIDFVGSFTGIGTEGKNMLEACSYYLIYQSTSNAYDTALEKLKDAGPNSQDYERLAKDLESCFIFNKNVMIRVFEKMAQATSGSKQAYYKYCAKQAEQLSIHDSNRPDIMSYEEFMNINTDY